jgi:hypothetical protein
MFVGESSLRVMQSCPVIRRNRGASAYDREINLQLVIARGK